MAVDGCGCGGDDMKELVGKRVMAVLMSQDSMVIAFDLDDGTRMAWQAEGDCCSAPIFYQCEDFDLVVGEIVTRAYESEVVGISEDNYGDVVDATFYTIQTAKGRGTIEFRLSHNGYYSGRAVLCGADALGDDPKVIATAVSKSRKSQISQGV